MALGMMACAQKQQKVARLPASPLPREVLVLSRDHINPQPEEQPCDKGKDRTLPNTLANTTSLPPRRGIPPEGLLASLLELSKSDF